MQKRPDAEHETRVKEVFEYLRKVGTTPFANHIFLNPFDELSGPIQLLHDVCVYLRHQLLDLHMESGQILTLNHQLDAYTAFA